MKRFVFVSVLFTLLSLRAFAQDVPTEAKYPQLSEEGDLLIQLLKPHEGKVILIDIWSTWCGPCRQAMNDFSDAKESYRGKDVVFVYLADELSPEEAWRKSSASTDGMHYRLTNEDMNYLKNKLDVSGIPSYAIFDKKGEQVYSRTGFEGAKKLSEVIDKCLAE
ncbi:TlpA family protein disulfide reductase [Dysgonomonas sp. Marseille-P4361]|uniref:TlpA family protein disulfide reductase n=1 Tax=Dysgonomonas sp. Marseille-P4361 TaxID=2161820 RepID=UPI000D551EA6|nr:TlpA family protein disulfide reductase [Dysgonomonas sp. Marseille-P4361]